MVTFDRLLRTGPTVAANWDADLMLVPPNRFLFLPTGPGLASGATVTLQMAQNGISLKPADVCRYKGVPPDVVGRAGFDAAPFVDFPVTVVP